jgi:hypothetical protein
LWTGLGNLFTQLRGFPSSRKKLPKSFYDKGAALLEQAESTTHPELRSVAIEAAGKYYEADIKRKEPFAAVILTLLLVYVLVAATAIWAFSTLPYYTAIAIVVSIYVLSAFLVGSALRIGGYITESTYKGILKAGFKTLLRWRQER